MKKELIAFVKECNHEARIILKMPVARFAEEDFHVLRTTVKKLKAITVVFKGHAKKVTRTKITGAYKKVFRSAGIIRELQLEVETLRRFKSTPNLESYINLLKENIAIEKKRFEKIKADTTVQAIKKAERKMVKMIKAGKKNDWKNSLEKLKKKIDHLLTEKFDSANLHLLRKQLKIYKYTAKFDGREILPALDEIVDSLGEWHDSDVLNNHLRRAVEKKIIPKDDISIQQSKERLLKWTKQLQKEVRNFSRLNSPAADRKINKS